MNLTLRDIGAEHFTTLLRRRLNPAVVTTTSGQLVSQPAPSAKPRAKKTNRRLMRYWMRDLNLNNALRDKTEEIVGTSPSFSGGTALLIFFTVFFLTPALAMLAASAPPALPIVFTMLWAFMVSLIIFSPRSTLKNAVQKPVTTEEIESLLPNVRGRLDRSYLTLVLDVLRHESAMSPAAQNDIKAALSALGDTISRLPGGPIPTADPALLRREAEEFRLEAGRENDAFVRASFLRQAESLEKRAQLGGENATSARRISALRREARTQMNALRALLAAFSQTAPGEAAQNVALSEAVSRVSGEAQAVSQAHRELADAEIAAFLGHPMPANIPVQPLPTPNVPSVVPAQTQTAYGPQAAGGNPNVHSSQPAPQTQQVGNGTGGKPWWRG